MCGRTVTLLRHVSAKPRHDHGLHAFLKTLSQWVRTACFVHISTYCGNTYLVCRWTCEFYKVLCYIYIYGPGCSVGTTTDYVLHGPGSNPGGDEIFRPSRPALGPTQSPVKWVPGSFPGVKCGRGVLLTTHPLLVPRSWKSRAIPLPTLWATPGL